MAKKRKTGSRRKKTEPKTVLLTEFARAHRDPYAAKTSSPESDEEVVRTGLSDFTDRLNEVAQSRPRAEQQDREMFADLEKVVAYRVEWNLQNLAALRDGRQLVPKEVQRTLVTAAKKIQKQGGVSEDINIVFLLDALLGTIDSLLPNEPWERATDVLAANSVSGKKGKHRWDGVTPEDKGCMAPFLVINYMLHSYCKAFYDRMQYANDLDLNELCEKMLDVGNVYTTTLNMVSVTGIPVNMHTTQYAENEAEVRARAELQVERLKLDPQYTNGKVGEIARIADSCRTEQDEDGWYAVDPAERSEGRGSTKNEAVQDLRTKIVTRLIEQAEVEDSAVVPGTN